MLPLIDGSGWDALPPWGLCICIPHFSSCRRRAGVSPLCAAWGMQGLCAGSCSCTRLDPDEQASLLPSQLQLLSYFAEGFLAQKQVPWKCDAAVFLLWCELSVGRRGKCLPALFLLDLSSPSSHCRHTDAQTSTWGKAPWAVWLLISPASEGEIHMGVNPVFSVSCPLGSHSFLAQRQSCKLLAHLNADLEKRYWNMWKFRVFEI